MSEPQLKRVVTAPQVVALGFGAMIGWSWVLLTMNWVRDAGTFGAPLAFAIGGMAIMLIALLYAELAAAMPRVGGEHVYVLRALGPRWSFWCSWSLIMAYVTVCVFEAVALPTAVEFLLPVITFHELWEVQGSPVDAGFVVIGVVGACTVTVTNLLGIRTAALLQGVVTIMIVLSGLFLIVGGATAGSLERAGPAFSGGIAGIAAVVMIVPAMLVGFDVIPQSAEEVDVEPRRMGVLLALSVLVAIIWYAAISFSVALGLSPAQLNDSQMGTADAASSLWGTPLAGQLLVVGGVGGILTSWNALLLGASRLVYAMAKDGMLPAVFARLHPRWNTPYAAIIGIGVLCCFGPLAGRTILVWLVDAGSFAIVIAYIFVGFAFLALRRNEPDMPRPLRLPYGMLIGRVALVMAIALFCLYLPFSPAGLLWPQEWLITLGMMVSGALVYWRYRSHIDAVRLETSGSD